MLAVLRTIAKRMSTWQAQRPALKYGSWRRY